jgi:uncharacterized protein
MGKMSQYDIQFSGLKNGKHKFEFKIAKEFFAEFEGVDINDADIDIKVDFEKNDRYLSMEFLLTGTIETICDRCLDVLELEINYAPKLYVNFGDETSDLTDIDDTMVLSRSEDKIELAKHFYDYICLILPIQKLHPEDENGVSTCNPEMIKNIEKYNAGQNKSDDEIDPRWEKLKNLYN